MRNMHVCMMKHDESVRFKDETLVVIARVVYSRRHREEPDWSRRNRSCRESLGEFSGKSRRDNEIQRAAFSNRNRVFLVSLSSRYDKDNCQHV